MQEELKLDVVLFDPYQTKAIAVFKEKTVKVDAKILADLLRGGFIATCYVLPKEIVDDYHLVRYRHRLVKTRIQIKNSIHGILLQEGIKIAGTTFTKHYNKKLHSMKDYRIDEFLKIISHLTFQILDLNLAIKARVRSFEMASLLTSIPSVGDYSSLVLASEIGNIERFSDSHKLYSYVGIVPSVRNSTDTIHHGHITKRGNSMVRWILVEAVHTHVRYCEDSDVADYHHRQSRRNGVSKDIVATATKLLCIIYWMIKEKRKFVPHFSWRFSRIVQFEVESWDLIYERL